MELYKNIKQLRIERRMTQQELANKTGYNSRSMIARIERGDVNIPQSKILAFAKALGVSASELMGEAGIVSDENDKTVFDLYCQLDQSDKAEIKGEIKGMLRADKYQKKDDSILA